MFLWMNVFTLCIWLACDSQRHERLQRIRYWFTSNHIPFRFGCRPREASRLEAKTHEAEAKPHEAEAEATTHEAEAEARFFGLEAEARPRGLTSLAAPLLRPLPRIWVKRKCIWKPICVGCICFLNTIFVLNHMYPENPEGTRVIVGSM